MRTSNKAFLAPAVFAAWLDRRGLTNDAAADALGLSPRMIPALRSGEKPLTKLIAMAMRGADITELVKPDDELCRIFARRGGSVSSKAKAAAARVNGAKGGRPRKSAPGRRGR